MVAKTFGPEVLDPEPTPRSKTGHQRITGADEAAPLPDKDPKPVDAATLPADIRPQPVIDEWAREVAEALQPHNNPLDVRSEGPLRPPDWRWQLALNIDQNIVHG